MGTSANISPFSVVRAGLLALGAFLLVTYLYLGDQFTMPPFLVLILKNPEPFLLVAVLVAEMMLRLYPTRHDHSLFNFLYRFTDAFLPNYRKLGGGAFPAQSGPQPEPPTIEAPAAPLRHSVLCSGI